MKTQVLFIAAALYAAANCNQALAYDKGDWLVRAGATHVAPDDSSSNVLVGGADLGIGVSVGSNTQLGLNIAYFVEDHWSVELLAATPFSHDIDLDSVGTLGNTKHLPPTLSAIYYPADKSSQLQPYVGVGVNYTLFFDEEFTSARDGAGFKDLSLDNSFGLSAQVGLDYMLDGAWHINASVRWIDIDTDANFNLNGAAGEVSVDIDPLVYTLSLGYRF